MTSDSVVLDASAVVAVLFAEKGGSSVTRRLPGAFLSAVNLAEVATRAVELGKPLEEVIYQIGRLPFSVVPFDAEQAHFAASLRAPTRHLGLSLGDRACLALGMSREALVVTGDRKWKELKLNVAIELFR
jgi:PIN domain nuclease of toxin-antitoxin system